MRTSSRPPDAGFAQRLRALADAAASEQVAWEHAHAAGLLWRPVPGAENAEPPYELRPGTGRRGPDELWARFDTAVKTLNRAITGSNAADVADAFGEIADAAGDLADAVAREDVAAHDRPRRSLTLPPGPPGPPGRLGTRDCGRCRVVRHCRGRLARARRVPHDAPDPDQ